MKNAKNSRRDETAMTHFIGVLAPDSLVSELSQCRFWMGERFGCRSGFNTPFHVTLAPPFCADGAVSLSLLASALDRLADESRPFMGRVSGFGAFGERTVFARVIPDENWARTKDRVLTAVSASSEALHASRSNDRFHGGKGPFIPHITIANRDIPSGAIPSALAHFGSFSLEAEFPVDHFALFEFSRGRWEIAQIWNLRDPL